MATARQLKVLLESYAESDDDRFVTTALQIAAYEATHGHARLAAELQNLVEQGRQKRGRARSRTLSLHEPRGELASLLSCAHPDLKLPDMVLADGLRSRLLRVLTEHRQRDKLAAKDLRPRHRILLLGPPGTGKTMAAAALAGELHLPLFTVLLHGLLTRFLGETAAKLKTVFDAIATVRGVYLFDEFDAIGGKRDAANDVGEIRRVLNSFLQFLEQDQSASIIVAATNHPDLLDRALFRRFDDALTFSLPTREESVLAIQRRLAHFDVASVEWNRVAVAVSGLSFADAVRGAENAARHVVLQDKSELTTEDLLNGLSGASTAQ